MTSNKTCQHSLGNSSVSPRIVTVCVHGANRRSVKQNGASPSIVADVVKGIRQQSWSKIDCVVFPGGFFFLPKYIGNLSYENRVSIIEAMDFSNTMRVACSETAGI